MTDMISREEALDAIDNERKRLIELNMLGAEDIVVHHARHIIEDLPAVNAVSVVRCKDCKHADTFADDTSANFPLKCLNIRYGGVYPYWYCEYGERREETPTRLIDADKIATAKEIYGRMGMVERPNNYVNVVRCKNCWHRDPYDKKCDCGGMEGLVLPRPDEWFCAYGERREENAE